MNISNQSEIVERVKKFDLSGNGIKTIQYAAHKKQNSIINTHCAYLIMGENYVLKIKRDVKYDYLDMSTLPKRRRLCFRELQLNKPLLPDIYLDVLPVTLQSDDTVELGGSGKIIEWALLMRRFNDNDVLDCIANKGKLSTVVCYELGKEINHYHGSLDSVNVLDGDVRIREVIEELGRVFTELNAVIEPEQSRNVISSILSAFDTHRPLLRARGEQGFVKRCHGDLHLRNVVLINGKPTPFDALEFDERLGTTDVLYDIAFLMSDLASRGLDKQCNAVLNGYIHSLPKSALIGLGLLPLFIAIRTSILAMTNAQREKVQLDRQFRSATGTTKQTKESASLAYHTNNNISTHLLTAALSQLKVGTPVLVAVGGLSGSGKSTIAREIAPKLGPSYGCVHLNSDIERKRIAGIDGTDRLPKASYTKESAELTYTEIMERCTLLVDAGQSVIVDATFIDIHHQQMVEAIAVKRKVPFLGVWLGASPEVLRARINARHHDVSDATTDVLEKQLANKATQQTSKMWDVIDASDSVELVSASVLHRINNYCKAF